MKVRSEAGWPKILGNVHLFFVFFFNPFKTVDKTKVQKS